MRGEAVAVGEKVGNLLEIIDASASRDEIIAFVGEIITAEVLGVSKRPTFALGENLAEKFCADPEIMIYLCINTGLAMVFDEEAKTLGILSG